MEAEGHVNYSYDDLFTRISKLLKDKNPALAGGQGGIKGQTPDVVKLGTTKTTWMNFNEMVEALDRKHEHLMSYIAAELGAEASLGPTNNLILQGRFSGKNIEILYKKYLNNFVVC